MKEILRIVSVILLISALSLLILQLFINLDQFVHPKTINGLVIIYFVVKLYYNRLELKDKKARIQELETKIGENN